MPDVIMPRLSDSMQEGTILRWLKAEGEQVKRDEELVEIETDKAIVIYEADGAGTLSILASEGETVPVGALIARLGDGASASVAGRSGAIAPAILPAAPATAAVHASEPASLPAAPSAATAPAPAGAGSPNGTASSTAVKASPLARRTAQRLGVELASLLGSGFAGRIVKADVLAAAAVEASSAPTVARPLPREPAPSSTAPTPSVPGGLTRTQQLIARRMAESRASVPDFALQVDVDMAAALDARASFKQVSDAPPTLNDFLVKVAAIALRRHPRVNGSYSEQGLQLHGQVNVGIAVATEDALVVPTIADADTKSLGTIAAETRHLIAAAHARSLTPAELDGGTFTVSNLGMYDIDRFEGIINAPQAAILCAGAIRERPAVREGRIEARPSMTLTLACDHRILYGAHAAEFLAEVRRLLEQPLAMAL